MMAEPAAERNRVTRAPRPTPVPRHPSVAVHTSPTVTLNAHGRVLFATPEAAAMFGSPASDLVAQPFANLLAPAARPACADFLKVVRLAPRWTGLRSQLDAVRSDGSPFPVEVIAFVWGGEAKPVATLLLRDLTDERRAAEARATAAAQQEQMERLQELDRFRLGFINRAAHELGTPLTPIVLQLHLLSAAFGGPADERVRRSLDVVERNVGRLRRLETELVTAAQLQAKDLKMHREPVDLQALAAAATRETAAAAAAKGVALALDDGPPLHVQGDAALLRAVLAALLDNALKATPAGGRVRVAVEDAGAQAKVRVVDTGIGLPADAARRLFRPFGKVGLEPGGETGAGLGLYVAKGIVELHGGRISCKSAGLGKGATFTVALPRASPASASG